MRRSAGSGPGPGSERAWRGGAGLDAPLDEERAELVRFVARMATAAEARDLGDDGAHAGAGIAFPPLKRRIRSLAPDRAAPARRSGGAARPRAAQAWLARFRALGGDAGGSKPGAGVSDE